VLWRATTWVGTVVGVGRFGLDVDLGLVVGVVVEGCDVWSVAVVRVMAAFDFFTGWLVFRWLPT
jgi:hypothetical protein